MLVGIALTFTDIQLIDDIAHVLSDNFMNLLKFISLPIIFFSLSATITSLGEREKAGAILLDTLRFSLGTTVVAALIAMALYQWVEPASGLVKPDVIAHAPVFEKGLSSLVPDNIFVMFADQNVVAIVLFALLFGWITLELPEKERDFVSLSVQSIFQLFLRIAIVLMQLLPFVIWAFVLGLLHQENPLQTLELLGRYFSVVLGANFIQGFVVLPVLLMIYQLKPFEVLKSVWPALVMAAVTKSSTATLPLTIDCAKRRAKFSEKRSEMILPLCSTINMNACSAFIYVTVLFVAQINGVTFSTLDMFIWVFLSVMAAFGNAGVPMGCYFMATAYLVNMNVPTEMMGLILPFYTLLDMVETPINVWSDFSILAILDRSGKAKPA